jgi:transposase
MTDAASTALSACAQDLPEEIDALKARIQHLHSLLLFFSLCYGHLHYKYRDLLRRIHGNRSEKLKTVLKNAGHNEAFSEEAADGPEDTADRPPASDAPSGPKPAQKPRKHGGGGRDAPPEHLPVVRHVIDLPEEQKKGLKWIRDEVTTQLEYRPGLHYLLQIVRPVYAHPQREHPPKVMPLPPQVIPQASVGVGFIVHCILSRYCDHIPYHRQEMIDARAGVFVSRQARYRYTKAGANLLMTIRDGLKQQILDSRYAQIDETFAPLIDPKRQGRTHTAYLWGYLSPKAKACVLQFSLSRSGDILEEFFPCDDPKFTDFDLQSDGARMYTRFVKNHPQFRHWLCWQHVRRPLIEAMKANETEALPLLEDIAELYRIEREATQRGLTDEQRGHWRHGLAKPILKRLQKRIWELKKRPTLFGNLRKAVIYAYRRWRQLVRYAKVGNGHILIDNNPIEAIFRPTKVGIARNSLFIGHPAAGWVSAVLYSIVATCKLQKVNPHAYLIWVLPKLAAAKTKTPTGEPAWRGLLPKDFAGLQPRLVAQTKLDSQITLRPPLVTTRRLRTLARCALAKRLLRPRECRIEAQLVHTG